MENLSMSAAILHSGISSMLPLGRKLPLWPAAIYAPIPLRTLKFTQHVPADSEIIVAALLVILRPTAIRVRSL